MTGRMKQRTLFLLGVVILLTMMIASNLTHLELQSGMPLPRLQHGQLVIAPAEDEQLIAISAPKFILVFIGLVLTAATLYLAYQLFRGVDWKIIVDLLRYILLISVVIGCLVFLVLLFPGSGSYIPAEMPVATVTPKPVVTSPLGSAPVPLLWLVGIGLFAISVFVVLWIIKPADAVTPLDLVGLEAEKAHHALKNGWDLKDVIVNCYVQMSLALKQEQGIERKDFMTTGEFEHLLVSAGIPREPIHQLTRLFDAVRYGNWQPNPADEQQAIQCLESIMLYSRADTGGR